MHTDIPQSNSLFVASLAKGFVVLRSFKVSGSGELTIREIMDVTGFDRSLVQRLTNTLHSLGYLERNEKSRAYRLGLAMVDFSFQFLCANPFMEAAMPCLIGLGEELGSRVTFGLWDGGQDIVCVYSVPRTTFYHATSHFGERQPIYATAAGRAIAAFLLEDEARELIEAADRKKITACTLTDVDDIMEELETTRLRGYCYQHGEFIVGETVIAAPVFGPNGRPRGVVATSFFNTEETEDVISRKTAFQLMQAAGHISQAVARIPAQPT